MKKAIVTITTLLAVIGSLHGQKMTKGDKNALKDEINFERDAMRAKYTGRQIMVMKEGVITGLPCVPASMPEIAQAVSMAGPIPIVRFLITPSETRLINPYEYHCDTYPVHKGEMLKVLGANIDTSSVLHLSVVAVAPHSITRGTGAYAHQSVEAPIGWLMFSASNPKGSEALAEDWVRIMDAKEVAAALASVGNTASGVVVDQIGLGMTFLDVERVMGTPKTRVDLGEKVLYKYSDMTIEFQLGKVTDVR
jgi:hypothetical protein